MTVSHVWYSPFLNSLLDLVSQPHQLVKGSLSSPLIESLIIPQKTRQPIHLSFAVGTKFDLVTPVGVNNLGEGIRGWGVGQVYTGATHIPYQCMVLSNSAY